MWFRYERSPRVLRSQTAADTVGGRVSDIEDSTSASSLTAAVLDEEAARQASQAERSADVIFADDLLPGVGSDEMPLKEGLRKGGFFTFVVLLLLNSLDELEQAAINILGPDIAETFGVSDGTITFISTASVAFFVLGAGPMAVSYTHLKLPTS